VPWENRTLNLRIRNPLLYPVELKAQKPVIRGADDDKNTQYMGRYAIQAMNYFNHAHYFKEKGQK
jgi:hypothetical protein